MKLLPWINNQEENIKILYNRVQSGEIDIFLGKCESCEEIEVMFISRNSSRDFNCKCGKILKEDKELDL